MAGGFDAYVRDYLLEDYLDGDGRVVQVEPAYWKRKGMPRDEYIRLATDYLDRSERIIRNRGARIVAELRHRLD